MNLNSHILNLINIFFFEKKKDENDLIGMRETRGKLANILLASFRNHEKYKSLSVTFNNII